MHIQFAHGLALIANAQHTIVGESPDDRSLDFLFGEQGHKGIEPLGRDREYHPFLGLGDPDLVVA